jgi:hypothetical protein
MTDTRRKNVNWTIISRPDGVPWDMCQLAVLMDIRDELQTLNRLLGCSNFTAVPSILRGIRRNTAKPRKPRARKEQP